MSLKPLLMKSHSGNSISSTQKGNYQWRGIYNGEALSFNMKSNEFKTLVQSGNIEFKN